MTAVSSPFIYMLPLPLTGGGRKFFGGVVFARAGLDLRPVERPQFMWCKPPERVLPSPSYLFAQALDPFRYAHGMKERRFFGQLHDLIKDMTVLTWDAGLFADMDLRALQVLRSPNLTRDAGCICSVRTALFSASLLGTLTTPPERALERSSVRFRQQDTGTRKSPERRLTELTNLTLMLGDSHRALLSYQLRPASSRLTLLEQAVSRSQLLCAVTNGGKIALLRPLERRDDDFTALALSPGEDVIPTTIGVNGGENVAPPGVLTPERCQKLGLSLSEMIDRLSKAAVPSDPAVFPQSPAAAFRAGFTGADRDYLEGALELDAPPEPPEECTPKIMEYFYMYLGDEERGRLGPTQYRQYEEVTRRSLEKRIGSYVSETNNLVNYADENDPADAELIAQITRYAMSL